jgi:GMP synthase (glutamine-hydrolysing)
MEILVILHNEVENAGAIETWADVRRFHLRKVRSYRGEALPPLSEIDMLFILGGAQSANDTKEHPYLLVEIDYIAKAHAQGIPLLGVCLGAQLIGKALGGVVEKCNEREIGFFPVARSNVLAKDSLFADFPEVFDVMHWHFDWVSKLPEGAEILLSSAGCPVQAYRIGDSILGVQFHIEMLYERALMLAKKLPEHFDDSRFVIPPAEFKKEQFERLHSSVTYPLLDRFVMMTRGLAPAS